MSRLLTDTYEKAGKFPYTVYCWIFNHKMIDDKIPEVLGLPQDFLKQHCKRCGYAVMEKFNNDHILFMTLNMFKKYVLPNLPPHIQDATNNLKEK